MHRFHGLLKEVLSSASHIGLTAQIDQFCNVRLYEAAGPIVQELEFSFVHILECRWDLTNCEGSC